MRYLLILVFFLFVQSSCKQPNLVAVRFVVDPASVESKASSGWFHILEQFRNGHKNAAAYLCVRAHTNDTVWVLSPRARPAFSNKKEVWVFYNYEVKVGDTLLSKINSEYNAAFSRYEKVIGRPGIPVN